jgi:predicted O-methyltransferase YrrM
VRINKKVGAFFVWLVTARKPSIIVEFGTGFGVSGMYWLAGLSGAQSGTLFTFEPNEIWAGIAKRNLASISNRFTLTVGTFEDNVDTVLGDHVTIDVAFIDAIHTCGCVLPQLELVLERLSPGGIVIFDDIDFSDAMGSCWKTISHQSRFVASAEIENLGIVEVGNG